MKVSYKIQKCASFNPVSQTILHCIFFFNFRGNIVYVCFVLLEKKKVGALWI